MRTWRSGMMRAAAMIAPLWLERGAIRNVTRTAAMLVPLVLTACGTLPENAAAPPGAKTPHAPAHVPPKAARIDPTLPVLPPAGSGRGGYYKDDGPGENPPAGLAEVPDAEARVEPYSPRANRPYVVFGKTYTPVTDEQPFSQRGTGSWYGKKFHGQRTSSGELYDMYKMTAAHPTLPIPSYARLTSIVSGKQVVVRINDRGPFHASRVIDVSYTAALKLGLLGKGSHELLIERLLPGDIARMRSAGRATSATTSTAAPLAMPAPLLVQSAVPVAFTVVPPQPVETTAVPLPAIAALMLGEPTVAAREDALGLQTLPASASGGFYLQLGAFSKVENAEAARSRLAASAGVPAALEVVQAGAVYRLFGGPFGSRQQASQAAQELPSALGLKPIVVQR